MYQQRRVKPNSEYYGNRVKRAFTLQRCFGSILQRQTSMNLCLNENKTTLLYNIVSAGRFHCSSGFTQGLTIKDAARDVTIYVVARPMKRWKYEYVTVIYRLTSADIIMIFCDLKN